MEALAADMLQAEYDPDKYHGLYLRFAEDLPLIMIYRLEIT